MATCDRCGRRLARATITIELKDLPLLDKESLAELRKTIRIRRIDG